MVENFLNYNLNLNNKNQARKLHLYLNKKYYDILFNQDEKLAADNEKIIEFKNIERIWSQHEQDLCASKHDCESKVKNIAVIESALKNHPVFNHPLFDYLCEHANYNNLQYFILNESILNIEFFDYLALSIVGVSDKAKSEIIGNLWDEAGKGNIQRFHTTMFKKLLDGLEIQYKREDIIAQMSWEALAGINLFSYLSLYSYNKMKYFGLLAATEILDPPHYHKLIKGISRILNKNTVDASYYVEHEIIDVEHAKGWVNKVILPELAKNPLKTRDFG